ncbi:PaaI family thioesterase [Chloroflexota bacterium]
MKNWPQVSNDIVKDLTMCFVCGQNNPIGLKLNFRWDNKTVKTEFTPNEFHQGWSGIVHGGIINCLLDEALTYAAYFEGINCITAKMQVRLRRPALIGEPLIITSSITKKTRRLVETQAAISLKDGTPVAEGTSTMFVVGTRENSGDKEEKANGDARK